MCGIFAIFCSPETRLPGDTTVRMDRALAAIKHRGPDASGTFIDPNGRFAVGHVRLSVIDIAASSNQPFWSACGQAFVVFNGEIYNYLELRAELEREGVSFRTNSDTEVLLQALMHWGPSCISRFNGMWAFVYGDMRTREFVVCRDRWGVKPLHTFVRDGMLVMCSEAKGIFAFLGHVPQPDVSSIAAFLKYSTGGENAHSWFRGVRRFPKGVYRKIGLLDLDPERESSVAYWNYPSSRTIRSAPEAIERMDAILEDAIRIRLRSDVPVGLSLSGGIDSATLAWMVGERFHKALEAYTAWHAPVERSELPMAQRIAGMFGHRSIPVAEVPTEGVLEDLSECVWHLDSGHSSPAVIPYVRLCRAARSSLTVMLEGQGSDELFAGYNEFKLFAGMDRLLGGQPLRALRCARNFAQTDGWGRLALNLARFMSQSVYERQAMQWNAEQMLTQEGIDAVPEQMRRLRVSTTNLNDALLFWHENGLTNLLQYGDALSMSVNLETRCPFLDYRLVELGFSLHEDLLIHEGYGKWALRKLIDTRVPNDLAWRRKKEGFTNSTERMIRERVERHGLPSEPVNWALDHGLFREGLRSRRLLSRMPNSVLFRTMSTMMWIERFYLRGS